MIEGRNYETWPISFHENLVEFPEVCRSKKPSAKGIVNVNMCRLFVGLVMSNSDKLFQLYNGCNVSVEELNETLGLVPVKKDYIYGLPPENCYAFYVKDTAEIRSTDDITKRKFGVMTIVKTGKNLGKINATNMFTQALLDASSKYNEAFHKANSPYVQPMLADGTGFMLEDIKPYVERLMAKENLIIQHKFDGNRMLAYYDKKLVVYSRQRKPIVIDEELESQLVPYLKDLNKRVGTVMCLDGELYKHGFVLSQIRSIVASDEHDQKPELDYHVFDVFKFDRTESPLTYTARYSLLETSGRIIKVPILEGDAFELYVKSLDDGYEGLMLKKPNAFYVPDSRKMVYKVKPVMRNEYKVIGYNEGTGKSKGQIVYELEQTPKTLKDAKLYLTKKIGSMATPKNTFNVIPKHSARDGKTSEQLHKEEFSKMNTVEKNLKTHFENNYYGKLYEIEFNDYSKFSIPVRAKGIGFR